MSASETSTSRRALCGLLLVAVMSLSACTSAPPDPGTSTTPSGVVTSDQTTDLQARFDAARPGDTVTLPAGTLRHSGVLRIRVSGITVQGAQTTLLATDDQTSSVQVLGDRVTLRDVTLAAPLTGKRWTGLDQHKLVVSGQGNRVQNVNVVGSAAAGVFVNGARDFTLDDIRVSSTRADGIHITNGSRNGVVDTVRTSETGDDGVAVVSYTGDSQRTGDITLNQVTVESTRNGRGITVVGGFGVTVTDFDVANTDSAGVYVATEGSPYFTTSVDDVSIAGGTIRRANTSTTINQGALVVFSGNAGQDIRQVRFADITIEQTPSTAGRDIALLGKDTGSVSGVGLNDVRLNSPSVSPLFSELPPSVISLTSVTSNGRPVTVGGR